MALRARNKLAARQVPSLTEPDSYSDGGGLYLRSRASGRSWAFIGTLKAKGNIGATLILCLSFPKN